MTKEEFAQRYADWIWRNHNHIENIGEYKSSSIKWILKFFEYDNQDSYFIKDINPEDLE